MPDDFTRQGESADAQWVKAFAMIVGPPNILRDLFISTRLKTENVSTTAYSNDLFP
jgi:ethanolamine utilization microcompartment shell protein EutL